MLSFALGDIKLAMLSCFKSRAMVTLFMLCLFCSHFLAFKERKGADQLTAKRRIEKVKNTAS